MKRVLSLLLLLALAAASIWYSLNPRYPVAQGLDLQGGMRVTLEPDASKLEGPIEPGTMEVVRNVLETRVNSFGLSGTEVRLKGDRQILILLPGVKKPEEALKSISKVAQLEFRHLSNVVSDRNPGARYRMSHTPGNAVKGEPDSYSFTDTSTNKPAPVKEVVEQAPLILKGNYLRATSQAVIDPRNGQPQVSFEFNSEGAQRFATFTSENVGEILAIVLDDEIVSAPNITEAITEGRGQISGGFTTMAEARVLANLLNSGALPVPMRPAETQTVGATLGQESIDRSVKAGLAGLGIVAVFMLLYYWLPGFIACLALVMYASLTFSLFKLLGIVLDLPGITGFILSIGMAVDGNILIFERMKEELQAGKSLQSAIETGFSRAFGAILDSNITVWVISAILIWLGSPMVKGFAITLALGNAVAMFTAITVTRVLLLAFTAMPWARNPKLYALNNSWLALVFPAWRQGAVLRIFEKRKIYLAISGVLVAVSLVFIALSPFGMGLKPGVDFTGGTILEAAFRDTSITRDQVVAAMAEAGVPDATVRIGRSEQPWTVVTVEATDVTAPDIVKVRERLERSPILNGFDPDAYKAGEPGKTFTATATFTVPVTEQDVRRALAAKQDATDVDLALKGLKVTTQTVQHTGNDRIPVAEVTARQLPPTELEKLTAALNKLPGGTIAPMSSATSIGPSIAREATTLGLVSVIAAVVAMVLFLAFRFAIGGFNNGLKFGAGAAFAIIQDVLIVVGLFAVMGAVAGWQVDSLFLTACLGLLGFAVNDVIVVYDRIRENIRYRARGESFAEVANRAMTQSFDRSFNTNFFIMLALGAMAIFGGESLRLFNVALLFGLAVASFTSIYVATPMVVMMESAAEKRAALSAGSARPAARADQPVRRREPAAAGPRIASAPSASKPTADGESTSRPKSTQVKPKRKRRL
ncbi:MAG: protein translocase subunit SecD [Actinomycetota bacterium]